MSIPQQSSVRRSDRQPPLQERQPAIAEVSRRPGPDLQDSRAGTEAAPEHLGCTQHHRVRRPGHTAYVLDVLDHARVPGGRLPRAASFGVAPWLAPLHQEIHVVLPAGLSTTCRREPDAQLRRTGRRRLWFVEDEKDATRRGPRDREIVGPGRTGSDRGEDTGRRDDHDHATQEARAPQGGTSADDQARRRHRSNSSQGTSGRRPTDPWTRVATASESPGS